MFYDNLFVELEKLKDEKQAEKMSNYMQNKFPFLGIPKPSLTAFFRPYLKLSKENEIDWDFVMLCWEKEYREAQYLAISYLDKHIKKIRETDLDKLKYLITNKSWWETVDSLDSMVGEIVLKNKKYEKVMIEWSLSDNLWLRRVSIDFQQRYVENTNKELLEEIIVNNLGSKEFFINKAIGWSLREYSKTNQPWVKEFIDKYKDRMANLSVKEASKIMA